MSLNTITKEQVLDIMKDALDDFEQGKKETVDPDESTEAFEEGYGAALCDIEAKIKEYFSG